MQICRHPFGKERRLSDELRRAIDLVRVSDIATPITHVFPAGTPLGEIGRVEYTLDHAFALVTERGRVVGYVNTATLDPHLHGKTTLLGTLVRRIRAEQIVSGAAPALKALFAIEDADEPVWVVGDRDIDHELQFWDFEDTLVRLSLLGILLVLEDALWQRAEGSTEACLSALPRGRREQVESVVRRMHGEDSGDVLRATSFSDKRLMVKSLPHVFGFEPNDPKVDRGLESAIDVRNAIAHGDYLKLRPGPGEDPNLNAIMSLEDWKQCVSSWLSLLRTLDPDIDLNFDRGR